MSVLRKINIGAVQQVRKSSARPKKSASVVDLKNCCKMNRCSPDSRGKPATSVSSEQRSYTNQCFDYLISSFVLPRKRSRAAMKLGTYMPSTALKFQHFRHNESNNTSDHVSIGHSTNPNVLSYAGYEQLLFQSLTIQLAYWARSTLLQDPLVSNAGIFAPKK